jgi:adenylosuccinate synthase
LEEDVRRAWIVVDLAFGDAGKGAVTDALVRARGAHTVLRFNGGAQAGHNVVTPDGRHHTFSQFGSGTFVDGVRTFLSRDVVVHPTALLVEAERLASVGVRDALDRLEISEASLVVTPFHQAANRLRERARGDRAHGSCGVGVGESVHDALVDPSHALRMRDLRDIYTLRRALRSAQERKHAQLCDEIGAPSGWDDEERRVLEDREVIDRWIGINGNFPTKSIVEDEPALRRIFDRRGDVVFEGAQGVLLDEHRGFHPHTTWSTCTFERALDLLRDRDRDVTKLGVVRTYLTRHGAGPMPTEDRSLDAFLVEPHNASDSFQGRFRRGWFDAVLARYAVDCCEGIDALAITHLDALPKIDRWRMASSYEWGEGDIDRLSPHS